MALNVVRASSQYAEATSCPLGAGTLTAYTMAAWYRPSSLANGTAFGFGATTLSTYIALGANGTGVVFIEASGNDAFAGTMSSGVWGHIAGVQTSAGAGGLQAFFNGTGGSTATPGAVSALNRSTVGGVVITNVRVSFSGGDIAECAAWNVALSAAEIAILAKGYSPLFVRPSALVFYSPLADARNPAVDLWGGRTLAFGASTAAPTLTTAAPAHPSILRPDNPEMTKHTTVGVVAPFIAKYNANPTWQAIITGATR